MNIIRSWSLNVIDGLVSRKALTISGPVMWCKPQSSRPWKLTSTRYLFGLDTLTTPLLHYIKTKSAFFNAKLTKRKNSLKNYVWGISHLPWISCVYRTLWLEGLSVSCVAPVFGCDDPLLGSTLNGSGDPKMNSNKLNFSLLSRQLASINSKIGHVLCQIQLT